VKTVVHPITLCAVIVMAAACATSPVSKPELLREARDASDAAATAYAAGKYDEAISGYAAAYDHHRRIDNPPGIVRNLLNMATVANDARRDAQARGFLSAIDRYTATLAGSSPRDLTTPEMRALIAETAALKARRALDGGNPSLASAELAGARRDTGRLPPAVDGRLANLEARAAEHHGDAAAMLRHAKSAAAANRRGKDRAELADSLRIAGRASLSLHDPAAASRYFEEALDLDRALARPNCVAADLDGLAAVARLVGDPGRAIRFEERASAARGGPP
jgi:tetratricopeptide (TPR) repeat protein